MFDKEIRRIILSRLLLRMPISYEIILQALRDRHSGSIFDYEEIVNEFISNELEANAE